MASLYRAVFAEYFRPGGRVSRKENLETPHLSPQRESNEVRKRIIMIDDDDEDHP